MKNDTLHYLAAALCLACLSIPAHAQRNRNRDLNINFESDAEHCSDVKARSEGQIAQAVESFTLQRAEAPTLEINGADRGGIRVRAWDRAEYSLEACKIAVAEERSAAEQTLRGIAVSRSGSHFSTTGPSGGDVNWQVYFIVHAPKDGNLDLETKNGPIDVAGVAGTIKIRATNGPIALRDSSGTVDARTVNGPIAFSGTGGEVHLNAQNGPIALRLAGDVWNGPVLEAHTQNGPVSLTMPDTFRTGIRVETAGHSPISCQAGACQGAWTDNASEHRTIQLNGSQDTIRLSTTNGPVSVRGGDSKGHQLI